MRSIGILTFALVSFITVTMAMGDVDRPNVIVILTDDQGFADVGINGNKDVSTPSLDQFAQQGVQFTRFYCCPVCAPTRSSLMTGRYHYRTGVIHTSRGGAKMHGEEITVAELLRNNGYTTGIFGKWHLGDNYPMRPQDQGFDDVLVHKSGGIGQTPDKPNSYFDSFLWQNGKRIKAEGYCTDVFFSAAMDFIEKNREQPFFVYLPTNAPHTPLEIADQYTKPYLDKGLDATTAKVYGMITNIDDNFGRLIQHLDRLKLRENTLIVFVGDNGPQQKRFTAGLRGRKGSTYEGGIRVPCFVQWPAKVEGGRKIDRIAAHIDLLPTLIETCLLEVAQMPKIDGRSIVPLLTDGSKDWPDRTLFFQCHRGLTPKPFQNSAVVTQKWKLVGYPGTFSREDLEPADNPIVELYDLESDPSEEHDVVAQNKKVVATMKKQYMAWFRDVEKSRQFQAGVIHIGTKHENPSHLCRYQDGTYQEGKSEGWSVKVKGGRYKITINRGTNLSAGRLLMQWGTRRSHTEMEQGQRSVFLNLWPDENILQLQFQAKGQPLQPITDNGTLGDVVIERVN